jgi:hypothetical protein
MENNLNKSYEKFENFMAEYIATYPYCDDSNLPNLLKPFNNPQIEILMKHFFGDNVLLFLYNIDQYKILNFIKIVDNILKNVTPEIVTPVKPQNKVYVPPHKRNLIV